MMVRTCRGRKGDVVCEIEGILCLFPRRMEQPEADRDIDVMITHHPNPVWVEAADGATEYGLPKRTPTIGFLFVAPVTDDHVLVSHKGFECCGSMCRTTARIDPAGEARLKARFGRGVGWLTPGRSPVIETDNVNVGWSYADSRTGEMRRQEWREPVPSLAFVSMTDLRDGKNRVCGLPDLSHVDPLVLRMVKRRRERAEAAE